jgi:alpha-ketoglutarate-dependent taurine dioxygenase
MNDGEMNGTRPVRRLTATRRAVSVDPADLVDSEPLGADHTAPLVYRPRTTVDLAEWVRLSQDQVEQQLLSYGAVLFRGFSVASAEQFEGVVRAFNCDLLNYVEGSSPRVMITEKVYSSTEYPPEFEISMHNELSYTHKWPEKLFFFCQSPPDEGGETPIADGRRLLAQLPADVVQRFSVNGVRYLRTMHSGQGPGLSWQTVFETRDRDVVEEYCREGGIEFSWLPNGWLRTRQVRPAAICHPKTGERVWFNQADQWHPSNLGPDLDRAITTVTDDAELPLNAEYGDGTPIDISDLRTVRAAARDAAVAFSWMAGDILVIDNTMTLHGRRPFTGPRRVLVAMGGTVRLDQVERAL